MNKHEQACIEALGTSFAEEPILRQPLFMRRAQALKPRWNELLEREALMG